MRKGILLVTLIVASGILGACSSKIEGESSALPPAGGPKASAKHPPGESESVINQEKR